jgi:hypothetical protein
MAVGADGAVYVGGSTFSQDFPITPGALDTTYNGGGDIWVSKLSPDGASLLYSTFLGGVLFDDFWGIALDADGAAYMTGYTSSADFPTTPGAFDTTYNGSGGFLGDTFVSKLSPDGARLRYSTFLGGSSDDEGFGIAIDPAGDAYITGVSYSEDFPTTPGAFDTTFNGGTDIWVSKLSPDGANLLYSTFLGGSRYDDGYATALDAKGVVYITGATGSEDFPTTPGAFDTSLDGPGNDGIVSKVNASPGLHVGGIQAGYRPAGNQYRVGARVLIAGDAGAPVSGATVAVSVTLPSGRITHVRLTTGAHGTARASRLSSQTGTYIFCVADVRKTGYAYDPTHNVRTCASVTIPWNQSARKLALHSFLQ